jgi:hypothetical protein
MWNYISVKTGIIVCTVWRKISISRYKVVGTNTIVAKGKVNKTIYPAIITSAVE